MNQAFPLLEFDASPRAILEPHMPGRLRHAEVPDRAVGCFFMDVIDALVAQGRLTKVVSFGSEMGEHPLYALEHGGQRIGVYHPLVGAPVAAALLEEIIACGVRKFMVCGGAGVLDRAIAVGHLIVPTVAVRDEGTSYHYAPAAREINADPVAIAAIEAALTQRGVDYLLAKTWTTDAIYRETRDKVALRRAEGCLTVEMEASAFMAVAQFRGVTLGQILYGGDDVSGADAWDSRDWDEQTSVRERLFWLTVASVCAL